MVKTRPNIDDLDVLWGATAYVGTNAELEPKDNYFLVDGTADNVQINAAIDYAGALGGGIVHLSLGTFTIAATVAMDQANVILEGEGKGTLIDSGVVDIAGITVTAANCVIRQLAIDQNKSTTYPNAGVLFEGTGDYGLAEHLWITNSNYHAVFVSGADDVTVQHCFADECGAHGIFAQECSYPRFLFNKVIGCSDTQFEFYYLVYDGLMEGNIGLFDTGDATLDGIAVQGSSRCRIVNNEMYLMPRYGILTGNEGDVDTDCDRNIYIGNTLTANTSGDRDAAICIEGKAGKTCHHTIICDNEGSGFDMGVKVYGVATFRSDHLVIKNNIMSGFAASSRIGVYVASIGSALMTEHAVVQGNVIEDSYLGIKFEYVDNSQIQNNNIVNDSGYSFDGLTLDYSNYNRVTENIIHSLYAGTDAIQVNNDSDENVFRGNTLYAATGINIVNANCNLNDLIGGNDFHRCTAALIDTGTGTILPKHHGGTAVVGFDADKDWWANYWYVDGTADDVQIQAAMTYVIGLGGGDIYLEEGTYDITASLVPDDYVWVRGAGLETVLQLANAVDDYAIKTTSGTILRARFSDFSIEGNSAGQSTGGGGIRLLTARQCQFRDIYIRDTYVHGIYFEGAGGSTYFLNYVSGCEFDLMGSSCIYGDQYGEENRYLNNKFGQTDQIAGTSEPAMQLEGIGNDLIYGNHFVTCDQGIELSDADNVIIMANHFDTVPEENIILTAVGGATGTKIIGNDFQDGASGTANTDPVISVGYSSYVLIQGNTFRYVSGFDPQYAIWAGDGSDYVTVTDNHFLQAVDTAQIHLVDADDWIIEHNVFDCTNLGISITASAANTRVQENTYINAGTCISDSGVNTILPQVRVFPLKDASMGQHQGAQMLDGADTAIGLEFDVPDGFQELVSAVVVCLQIDDAGSGNMVWSVATDAAAPGETYTTHEDTDSGTDTMTQNTLISIDVAPSLTNVAAGDLVGLEFTRDGDHASDTLDEPAILIMFKMRYV